MSKIEQDRSSGPQQETPGLSFQLERKEMENEIPLFALGQYQSTLFVSFFGASLSMPRPTPVFSCISYYYSYTDSL